MPKHNTTVPGVQAERVVSGNKEYNRFTGDSRGLETIATDTGRPIVVGNEYIRTQVTVPADKSDTYVKG